MRNCFKLLKKECSILVLDFLRPNETRMCLESLRRHVKFDNYEIILFVNGCQHDYAFDFYKQGLCDKLIVSRANEGIPFAEMRLVDFCNTEYFIFTCNDNVLLRDVSQGEFDEMKKALNKPNAGLINYAHVNPWSEKFFMMKRDLYLKIEGFTGGGCGPHRDQPITSEMTIHKFMDDNNLEFIHWEKLKPNLLGDIARYSMQETATGGIYRWRTDTQQFWWLRAPARPEPESFDFTDEEWATIMSGKWRGGTIPVNKNKWTFFFFSNEGDPLDPENHK